MSVSTYHSYAGRLVREHGLRLGYEADTRLLSEAAAWQTAHEAVVRYDGPMDDVEKAESTVTAAVVDLAGEMAEHLQTPMPLRHTSTGSSTTSRPSSAARRGGRTTRPGDGARQPARCAGPSCRSSTRTPSSSGSRDAMDFADQMALAARLAMTFDDIGAIERARHRVVLLDEFQDTSEAQLALLKALYVAPGETSA